MKKLRKQNTKYDQWFRNKIYDVIYFIRTLNIINDLINTTGKKAYI